MSDDLARANNLEPMPAAPVAGPHADGIYFSLPSAEYHADPALGSSGIRDLMISPLRYWINSPYNPNRPPEDESEAKDLGTYLHDLLLEGGTKNYAIKPEGMSFATKEGKAWREEHDGFVIINQAQNRTQQTMFNALELSSSRQRFTGGQPEVSVFWTEKTGQRCKIRLDYLKPNEALDLKTYSNTMDKDLETAIAHTIANRRIAVQAFWYDRGLSMMLKMLKTRQRAAVQWWGDGELDPELGDARADLVHDLARFEGTSLPLYFVFCETGAVPNITARRLTSHDDGELNAYWRWAKMGVEMATQSYAVNMKKFGPDRIWIDEVYFKDLTDGEMASASWVLARD